MHRLPSPPSACPLMAPPQAPASPAPAPDPRLGALECSRVERGLLCRGREAPVCLSMGVALHHPPSASVLGHTSLPQPCGIFFIFLWVPPSLGLLENVLIKNRMNCWEFRTVCKGPSPSPGRMDTDILLFPALHRHALPLDRCALVLPLNPAVPAHG